MTSLKKRAVVLLSGGIDSATAMAIARAEGYEIYALSFDYGQRHKIELESAREIANELDAAKHLVISFNLNDIGGSALTANINVPKISPETPKSEGAKGADKNESADLEHSRSIPVTYVPARNTIFLSFGLAWAETSKIENIFIGVNAVDYSGYPDCRPEFIEAFQNLANLATKESVEGKLRFRILTPLIKLSKAEIIKKGLSYGLDYAFTWSCYDPVPKGALINRTDRDQYTPCHECDSCQLRAKGFREAGIEDPLLLKH